MGLPTPSPGEIAALTALKGIADAGVAAGPGKVAAIQSAIDAQQEVENFQKSTFDTVNDEIIRRYEVERRWIDGQDIAAPIVEADLQSFASRDGNGRLWNGGAFDPLRIAEFDGTPLAALEADNETDLFTNQDTILDQLQNGISSTTLTNGVTNTAFNSSSTDGEVESDSAGELVDGNFLLITSATDSALVKVINVVESAGPSPFQYTFDIDEYIAVPAGTIAIGSDAGVEDFAGFNNTERTNKTANDSFFQNIMDGLIGALETNFNDRKTALNNEKTELQTNLDDNLDAQAETDVDTSITVIDGFLGATPPSTIDVSDTGIAAIDTEKGIRETEITQRIIDIAAAIAFGEAGTKSYYDVRFETTEGRVRLNNGSIVLLNDLETSKSNAQIGAIEAQGLSDRYDALIP